METYLDPTHFDLITPDGKILSAEQRDENSLFVEVDIEGIAPHFIGFDIEPSFLLFNLKSTLAQLGLDGQALEIELDRKRKSARLLCELRAIGSIGRKMLPLLLPHTAIGKIFAADPRRRVRTPNYLTRMLGRCDRYGAPLLSLGGLQGGGDLIIETVEGRSVAYLALQKGRVVYDSSIDGLLPTLAKALVHGDSIRSLLRLHQQIDPHLPPRAEVDEILLVKTLPLHIRTVFARVVDSLLPKGYQHTSASILQPDTQHSGDIYELFGESDRLVTDIPLEFYTLEPYREHVFFSDRDQLQASIEQERHLFEAFETAPEPENEHTAVFIVKGTQLLELTASDWITRKHRFHAFFGPQQGARQSFMVHRFIEEQPSYPILKSIELGGITSQGILLSRFFPSPLMKPYLLSGAIHQCLKGIYFQIPSSTYGQFFSHEDRALLHDLYSFAIPVYWVDRESGRILKYLQKEDRDAGMFVPPEFEKHFLSATVFGIYGSNLFADSFEREIEELLAALLELRYRCTHPLFNRETNFLLITGGGPGAMEVGNRAAKKLNILSCANIVDFGRSQDQTIVEQYINPYIDAKMTYRLDKLVERQAEFNLDFPIFLTGGVGTDFEYCLEEVRRKVGAIEPTPIILFGMADYWEQKISTRFQCNLERGTIQGSEWLSNCFYSAKNAQEAFALYRDFFQGILPIGRSGPIYPRGFAEIGTDYKPTQLEDGSDG